MNLHNQISNQKIPAESISAFTQWLNKATSNRLAYHRHHKELSGPRPTRKAMRWHVGASVRNAALHADAHLAPAGSYLGNLWACVKDLI